VRRFQALDIPRWEGGREGGREGGQGGGIGRKASDARRRAGRRHDM
jgi:hypothetical protein